MIRGRSRISIHAIIAIVAVAAILTWLVIYDDTAIALLRSAGSRGQSG